MDDETPKPPRKRSPYLGSSGVLFQFTDKGTPLDETRERKGRPARSPSLPPLDEPAGDQPKTDNPPPAA
ncbi:MAG: hypothetical protein K2V38_22420 [Gemmataceae bacterium]|nr:hypothetical protein [Gemmataceae bacterium]